MLHNFSQQLCVPNVNEIGRPLFPGLPHSLRHKLLSDVWSQKIQAIHLKGHPVYSRPQSVSLFAQGEGIFTSLCSAARESSQRFSRSRLTIPERREGPAQKALTGKGQGNEKCLGFSLDLSFSPHFLALPTPSPLRPASQARTILLT